MCKSIIRWTTRSQRDSHLFFCVSCACRLIFHKTFYWDYYLAILLCCFFVFVVIIALPIWFGGRLLLFFLSCMFKGSMLWCQTEKSLLQGVNATRQCVLLLLLLRIMWHICVVFSCFFFWCLHKGKDQDNNE